MNTIGITLSNPMIGKDISAWEMLAQQLPKNAAAVVGLPSTLIAHQKIVLEESLSRKEIERFVSSQLSRYLNLPIEQLAWDYEISNDTKSNEITLIATEKALIETITTAFSRQKRKIKAIEPISHAITRMITQKMGQKNYTALIQEETDFLWIRISNKKIAHYEKCSQTQLMNHIATTDNTPIYLVNITDQNMVSKLSNVSFEEITLSINEALSTWGDLS